MPFARHFSVVAERSQQLDEVVKVVADLEAAGYASVLVGGMALVLLGSQRLTRDFDLVIPEPGRLRDTLVKALYRRGLQLVTRFSPAGEAIRSMDNANVALAKLKMQDLRSVPFYDPHTQLRLDLLLDFPFPARDLLPHAIPVTTDSGVIRVASREDLIRLKETAYSDRKKASDATDLEFLRGITNK